MLSSLLRSLPSFKGKHRIARYMLGKSATNGKALIVNGKYGCSYKLPNIHETIGFEIFINGVYERNTIMFIKSKVAFGKYLVDIGANIGAISIPLKKIRPDIGVVCIEAAPWIFDFLQENIYRNDLRDIITINKAISASNDQQVEFFSPQEKFGKGSLAPVFTTSGVKVTTLTLDSLTNQVPRNEIGFIKIDVEGFEAQAFLGGKGLLANSGAPDVLFEFVDWAESAAGVPPGEAQRILMSYGYRIQVLGNNSALTSIDKPIIKGSVLLYATRSS